MKDSRTDPGIDEPPDESTIAGRGCAPTMAGVAAHNTDLHLQSPSHLGGVSEELGDAALADGCKKRKLALKDIEEILRQLLLGTQAGRSEARMWLCTAAGSLEDALQLKVRRDGIVQLLPGAGRRCPDSRKAFTRRLVQLLCEMQPGEVGSAIADNPRLLRDFFLDTPSAVQLWFGQFSMSGISQFRYGARGLARFALTHRSEAWHHLEWEGKHPQAPVAVASKPHYFCELAVGRSVRNLLLDCPGFLESEELRECICTGDFLAVDYAHFTKILYQAYEDGGSLARRISDLMQHLLQEACFKTLSQKLVHLIEPSDLCNIVNGLLPHHLDLCSVPPGLLAFSCSSWKDLDDMILFSAMCSAGARVSAILHEDENRGLAEKHLQMCAGLMDPQISKAFWPCLKAQADRSSRRHLISHALLEAWVQRCSIDACLHHQGAEAVARLLRANSIDCKLDEQHLAAKQGEYKLLETNRKGSRKHKRKKKEGKHKKSKRQKRKRRRHSSSDSSSEDGAFFGFARDSMNSDDENGGFDHSVFGSQAERIADASGLLKIRFAEFGQPYEDSMAPVRVNEVADFVSQKSLQFWLSIVKQ